MERISTAGLARKGDTILLAKRKPGTTIGEAWEFPGGKADNGEHPEEALIREFLEELNIPIRVTAPAYSGVFYNGEKKYNQIAFWVKILSEEFQLQEHQEIAWVPLDKLSSYQMAESDRMIADYLQNNGFPD